MRALQGTVATFDPETRAGSVLLDSGAEVDFGTSAFVAGGMRLFRPGQRVRLERDDAGKITRVVVLTLA